MLTTPRRLAMPGLRDPFLPWIVGVILLAPFGLGMGSWLFQPLWSSGLALKETGLQIVVRQGDHQKLIEMLHLGANPNEEDNVGRGPIHTALWKGDYVAAELLFKAGANLDDEDNRGISLIEEMMGESGTKAAVWLKDHGVAAPTYPSG